MFKLRKGLVATAAIVAMLGTGMVVSADSTVGPNEQSVLEHIKEYANAEARGFYGLAESQFEYTVGDISATDAENINAKIDAAHELYVVMIEDEANNTTDNQMELVGYAKEAARLVGGDVISFAGEGKKAAECAAFVQFTEAGTVNQIQFYDGTLYTASKVVSISGNRYGIVEGKTPEVTDVYALEEGKYFINAEDGLVATSTGFKKTPAGKWYLLKEGVLDEKTGVVVTGSAYYVTDGVLDTSVTTLAKADNGVWYYIKNGKQCNDNTLVKYGSTWYHVNGGKLAKDTTLVKYNGNWYYVKGGKMCKDVTLVKYSNSWYYVKNGKICKDTTIVKYGSNWYYVSGGKKCVNGTPTLVKYNKKWYYVSKGKVDFKYTGTVKYNGKTYKVVKGVKQ